MTYDQIEHRVAKLETDNRRLRRLLEQYDAPDELRHRLRSTLAVLRTLIRRSAETKRDVEGYAAHLEDRLNALMRTHMVVDEWGTVGLRSPLVDELQNYHASEGEAVSLTGPDIEFEPRAGQVFAMAVHELAVNAVEHGVLGAGQGRIDVEWTVGHSDEGDRLAFHWKEVMHHSAIAPAAPPVANAGFGTEVLTRMLGYELKARTTFEFLPAHFACRIMVPLNDRIGRVAPGLRRETGARGLVKPTSPERGRP